MIVGLSQKEDVEMEMVTAKHVNMDSEIWTPELTAKPGLIALKTEFRELRGNRRSPKPHCREPRGNDLEHVFGSTGLLVSSLLNCCEAQPSISSLLKYSATTLSGDIPMRDTG